VLIQMLTENPLSYFRLIVILVLSICLHELAHGVAAIYQGDDTPSRSGHMTMNPVVHMGVESIVFLCLFGIAWGAMPVDPSKFRSRAWGDFIVSAAGPLSNLILGFICIGALKLSGSSQFISREFFWMAAIVNFNLCLFNCLPIPPLDGFYMFGKFFPGLRQLQHTSFGAIALMFLLVFGIGGTLSAISRLIVTFSLGVL
jgi:Zn-dependent protease